MVQMVNSTDRKRILFALPGLHHVTRGAEVAFESVAQEIAKLPGYEVTLIGSGYERSSQLYKFKHAGCINRNFFQKWPSIPLLRDYYMYEELSFVPNLLKAYSPSDYDLTVTCSYPYTNWVLRYWKEKGYRPAQVFVTQNGDWPAQAKNSEYKFFACDGLICTNPEYYERNHQNWLSKLIPNGVDPSLFHPGEPDRAIFKIPGNLPVVLMVSALVPDKRVLEGIKCVAKIKDIYLIVAGDGPLRQQVNELGKEMMEGRFQHLVVPRQMMPNLYRSADVFLHMSQDEPSANVYIEALATGLPIVTQDRFVTRWTLENEALFVDTSSESEVMQGIQQALNMKKADDISSRRNLVERRFSWSAIAQDYCEFFNQVLLRKIKLLK